MAASGGGEGAGGDRLHRLARGVARRYRMVLGSLVAGALVGLAIAAAGSPTYDASATLSFRSTVATLGAPGGEVDAALGGGRADELVGLARDPAVLERVRVRTETVEPVNDLRGAVASRVGPEGEIVIDVQASDAVLAADLANAVAIEIAASAERIEERRLDAAAERLERRLRDGGGGARRAAIEDELARIETLRALDAPAQLLARAAVPDSALSPRPLRNLGLGALIGLLVGLGVASVRTLADRRVHEPDEIRDRIGLPVLAQVREGALGHTPLLNADAPPMAESDFEAFRALRTNLGIARSPRAPRKLMITSGLPETGVSTVAASLAVAAALAGTRTLIVECDPRRPALAVLFGVLPSPGLTEYLRGQAAPREVLQRVELPAREADAAVPGSAGPGTLVCVSSGAAPAGAEPFVGDRFRDFLQKVSRAYGLVILDTGPMLVAPEPLDLVPLIDAVVVCARVSSSTIDELGSVRETLGRLPRRPAAAVITDVPSPGSGGREYPAPRPGAPSAEAD